MPDGCADIIYTREDGHSTLRFVGPMTRYQDFAQPGDSRSIGVRFRPAMWVDTIGLGDVEAADQVIALDQIWGKKAVELSRRLDDSEDAAKHMAMLASVVQPMESRSAIQRAVRFLERSHGQFSIERLADAAGFSERQFRRRCLAETALPPKLLARILRFRHAQALLPKFKSTADLAAACGYCDQSHLIAEFREFSGRTPRAFGSGYLGTQGSSAEGP